MTLIQSLAKVFGFKVGFRINSDSSFDMRFSSDGDKGDTNACKVL